MRNYVTLILALLLLSFGRPGLSETTSTATTGKSATLHGFLHDATELRVLSGPEIENDPAQVLLNLSDSAAVRKLVEELQFEETQKRFHCMCLGTERLEFSHGGKVLATLSMHHGRSLRWEKGQWEGDGLLKPASAAYLIRWLDEHGIHGPKLEVESDSLERTKQAANEEKWLKAMPRSLKAYWPGMGNPFGGESIATMDHALRAEYPDTQQRVLTLLTWFGSGSGPWSSFPAYENVPESLLLTVSTTETLSVLKDRTLTPDQTEGAARFLAGWGFKRKRPEDSKLLPPDLKKRLLEHCLASSDQRKRERAQSAFAER